MSMTNDVNPPIEYKGVKFRPLTMEDIAKFQRLVPISVIEQSTLTVMQVIEWMRSPEGALSVLGNRSSADDYAKTIRNWSLGDVYEAVGLILEQFLPDQDDDSDSDPTQAASPEIGS